MPTYPTIETLPPEDPCRHAVEGDYLPRDVELAEWDAIRDVTLATLEVDAAAASATASARATRRGRITQYVIGRHHRGYPTDQPSLLRSSRIEQHIAVRSDAATSSAGVDAAPG